MRAVPNPLQETTFGFVLSRQGHEKGKCNNSTKRYNDIYIKTMENRCHFSQQKQGKKRGYLKNHLQKTYQMLLEIRGSNQTRRIKCRSRENYQSRDHVGQKCNWNSVFQSAGCNPNATNRRSLTPEIAAEFFCIASQNQTMDYRPKKTRVLKQPKHKDKQNDN